MLIYKTLLCFLCYVTVNAVIVKMVPEFFWDEHYAGDFSDKCNLSCVLAENPSQPDAIIFVSMHNQDVTNAIGYVTNISIKILATREAVHYYSFHKIEYLKQFFQGIALIDWTSDIPWPKIPKMYELKAIEMPKNPAPKATFVARNCAPMSDRNAYVKAIDKLIGVVALSSCFHNTPWPQCEGRDCTKVEAIRGYKIHLAFENGDSPRYVSEKIFQAFSAGVLPVYLGTHFVSGVVPKGSYIDVADFASPEAVAQYLVTVLADDNLYRKYFEWKWKPFDKMFEDRFKAIWTIPFECRLCRYIGSLLNGWKWDQINQSVIIRENVLVENNKHKQTNTQMNTQTNQVDNSLLLDADKPQLGNRVVLLFCILLSILFTLTIFIILNHLI